MKPKVFALVDCNNFFVSCERVFRPDLWGKPVVVLSNNDAVIVARSNEAKALGLPMASPFSGVKEILQKNNVVQFSANFQLYGDFSQRVVRILQQESPNIEVYSVDESFLEISDLPITDYEEWGRRLSAKVFKWIGVPVSIGVAPSKTLAKAASDYTKKHPECLGAFSVFNNPENHHRLLSWLPVGDVWGVGYRTRPKLEAVGIKNALALSKVSDAWAQENLTIRGVRMVRELKGQSCINMEGADDTQKSILRSRSFGHTIRNYYELEGAIATFAAQIAAKLRRKKQIAGTVMTFLSGKRVEERHHGSVAVKMLPPTNNTGLLITAALQALKEVYDPDFGYTRAGVTFYDLGSAAAQQLKLGSDIVQLDRQAMLMKTVDGLNARMGTRVVRHASEHPELNHWFSKRDQRSPSYTQSWAALPVVKVY